MCNADIPRVAGLVPDWSLVAPALGFGVNDISEIEKTIGTTSLDQTKVFLRKWIAKRGKGATFDKLIKAVEDLGEHQQAADQIRTYAAERLNIYSNE